MSRFPGRWIWLLLPAVLAACATVPSAQSEGPGSEVATEPVSFEQACQQESSLLVMCGGQQCGLYPCREVMQHLATGHVVRTWGQATPLAEVGAGAQRYWGSAQELPGDSRPVFIIPWVPKPLLPSQLKELEEAAKERNKPHQKHHIFSQEFRSWFELKKINIDEYTIPLELTKHLSIHRGAQGGPWNAAWRQWIPRHTNATKEEIFRYAGQLIYEFELFGPVVPYWKRLPQPVPPGYKTP
ncbi:SitA6 family polymorphic toxin lipoprotein [Hyalangium versicolor]|uniref:SitA6 family polymorphic toxin lipoprotein n=1 Tax=Hyalangium versicolor TaxID=2861190 RepID=UPI001CCB60D6|nr:TIGR02269 family lipoprotein [Hyalangium versicolor]